MNAIVGMTYRAISRTTRHPLDPPHYVKVTAIETKEGTNGSNHILNVWVISSNGDHTMYTWEGFQRIFDYTRQHGQPTILHDKHIWQRLTDALNSGIMDSVSQANGAAPFIREREY